MTWDAPADPGASNVTYEVLRSRNVQDFVNFTQCLTDADPTDTQIEDKDDPLVGIFAILVRAVNSCPSDNVGTLGDDSSGQPRDGRTCF